MRSRLALLASWAVLLVLGCLDADKDSPSGNSPRGWFHLDSGLAASRLVDVYFPNADTGYAVGNELLKTTDGGATWSPRATGAEFLASVHFIDGRRGWSAGARGTVFRTMDGGETWLSAESRIDGGSARAVFFTGPLRGFCAGDGGVVSRTLDGGVTWTSEILSEEALLSLAFPSPDTGYVAGNRGVILRTVDRGANWTAQASGTLSDLWEVQFLTRSTGYAAGGGLGHGIVLKTTNAGETWSDVSGASTGSQGHTGMHFVNSATGWVVGDYGSIFRTTNGGSEWTRQDTATSHGNNLRSVFFVNSRKGWAVEMYNGLLGTLNGGVP